MTEISEAAFCASESITSGDWDAYLPTLRRVLNARLRLLDPSREPSLLGLDPGQEWSWVLGSGSPHWEIRDTGTVAWRI